MTETLDITLGARIRAARKAAGFNNAESLAVRLKVGHRTVQRWELDESEPSLSRLIEIARLTDRPLTYFIGADGNAPEDEAVA